jgi:hypothetical protein
LQSIISNEITNNQLAAQSNLASEYWSNKCIIQRNPVLGRLLFRSPLNRLAKQKFEQKIKSVLEIRAWKMGFIPPTFEKFF